MTTLSAPARRLTTYWKIEAGNAVFIPALAVYLVLRSGGTISAALVLSGLACSFLLVIGTIVLHMMLRQARGDRLGIEWVDAGPRLSTQLVAPAVLLLLAVLEYVNYYHVQLQHFDHAPDWQRLVSGRGFRRSHLAREIDRWERARRRGTE